MKRTTWLFANSKYKHRIRKAENNDKQKSLDKNDSQNKIRQTYKQTTTNKYLTHNNIGNKQNKSKDQKNKQSKRTDK